MPGAPKPRAWRCASSMRAGALGWLARKSRLASWRAGDIAELAVGGHRLQEAAGGVGIVAGPADRADADRVGLQLLVAGELRQPQLAADQRHLGDVALAEHVGDHLGGEHLLGLLLLALDAVIGGHMAHLMGDHCGQLGRIVGQRQQAARDVEIAAGQREGIDVGRVEDGDAIALRRGLSASKVRRPTTLATIRSSLGSEYSPP